MAGSCAAYPRPARGGGATRSGMSRLRAGC